MAWGFKGGKGGFGGFGGFGGKGGFVEEDRTKDWQCPNPSCRERNFVKRPSCFKCNAPRPKEEALRAAQPPPSAGKTMHGMVKSYNKKGFGFIMCMGSSDIQDLYFTRENVSSRLLHPDMPGEHVSFEIGYEGRRMIAKNVRPFGEDKNTQAAMAANSGGKGRFDRGYDEEDTSRDWNCQACYERNFLKRNVCFKCGAPKPILQEPEPATATPAAPRRTLSPHAGARAIREALKAKMGGGDDDKGGSDDSSSQSSKKKKKQKKNRKKRKRSSSGSSSSSGKKKKAGKKSKTKRSSSSADSVKSKSSKSRSRSSSSGCVMEEPSGSGPSVSGTGNPDVDKAKAEALEQLLKLKSVQPKEARMSEWRALLRKWHPDKNPERVEVATAVFQFLQKGKPMLDSI